MSFHPAYLRLLADQHPCFGHCLPEEPECGGCVVRNECGEQRIRNLATFGQHWSQKTRIGAEFQPVLLTCPTICRHCKKLMRPEEGHVTQVVGQGAYHTRCVDEAFPA